MAVHLVMELCEGGSVLDGLKDGEYSERQVGTPPAGPPPAEGRPVRRVQAWGWLHA